MISLSAFLPLSCLWSLDKHKKLKLIFSLTFWKLWQNISSPLLVIKAAKKIKNEFSTTYTQVNILQNISIPVARKCQFSLPGIGIFLQNQSYRVNLLLARLCKKYFHCVLTWFTLAALHRTFTSFQNMIINRFDPNML